MHVNWRWRAVALVAVALFSSIYGVARPQPAAADPAVNATPPASSADSARTVPCRRNVYPLMPNTILLEDNPPSWYRPVTMASIGLSPDAEESEIPGLNTTTPNSPRFHVDEPGAWVLWKSKYEYSSAPLLPMFMGEGTLSDGFAEYPFWPQDSGRLNGVLDAGDWLSLNFDQYGVPLADLEAVLDTHIAAKTRMILPVFDDASWQDIGASPIYRMQRLIEVRLLGYELTRSDESWMRGYLEFALLDDQKVCVATAALFMSNLARR
jgi:hypothetical protein